MTEQTISSMGDRMTGIALIFKKRIQNIKTWIKRFEVWTSLLIAALFFGFALFGPVLRVITIYPGYAAGSQNRLYLLSAIAQSLAAILALVVTITLVAVQLASQTFTPHVMRVKLRDKYFWTLIGLYLVTILASFWAMGWFGKYQWEPNVDRWIMETCLLLTTASLLFLIPYVYEAINSLRPKVFVAKLLKKDDLQAVEEILHTAVSKGFLTILDEVAIHIVAYTLAQLHNIPKEKGPDFAKKIAQCCLNTAKRAFRQNEQDAYYKIFNYLTLLTRVCTEKQFRGEADVFNDTVSELYEFAQEEEEG